MSPRLPWWAVWLPPVATAYAATILVEAGAVFDLLGGALLVVAGLAALVPWLLTRREPVEDERVGLAAGLASAIALHAVPTASPARSLLLELCAAVAPAAIGALVVWLALSTPPPPRPLAPLARLGAVVTVLAAAAGLAGALVCLAPFDLFGETIVLGGALLDLPLGVMFGGLAVAVTVRLAMSRLGSPPIDVARSSLAVLGLALALACAVGVGVAVRLFGAPAGTLLRLGWLGVHLALLLGHMMLFRGVAEVEPGHIAPRIRQALAALVTIAVAVAALVVSQRTLARLDLVAAAFVTPLALAALVLVHRLAAATVTLLFAPDRGRLTRALDEVRGLLAGARSIEDLGQGVLVPLARACRSPTGRPLLLLVTPALEISVDAAGQAHVRETEHSPVLLERLSERPGEVLLRAPLESLLVRRPDLRPLAQALERLDALAAVAIASSGELDGVLIVARGARTAAVTVEELAALNDLGARLSGPLAVFAAERRAQERAGRALLALRAREERIEALEETLEELRADATALKAGAQRDRFGQPVIAYGPSMRDFVARAEQVAALDGPVLVRAEPGTALEPIGHLLHAGSPKKDGPLVVADALGIAEGRAMAALFGTTEGEPHPGWLKLAQGGTLLLVDVPALPLAAQAALDEAIASRSFRPLSGDRSAALHALDVRVVATSRVDLHELVERGAFDAELARRLEPLSLVVPSLALRREDLRSLVLVALDRGCRALGRPPVGIEEDALKALLEHPFTEGTQELERLLERAIGRTRGPRVTMAELELAPPTPSSPGSTPSEPDAWVGSYTELETRILEKALERAGGNKSEAARALGLKRTTFLDKLRRAGLERPTTPPDPEA